MKQQSSFFDPFFNNIKKKYPPLFSGHFFRNSHCPKNRRRVLCPKIPAIWGIFGAWNPPQTFAKIDLLTLVFLIKIKLTSLLWCETFNHLFSQRTFVPKSWGRGGGGEGVGSSVFFFCDKFRFAPEIFGKSGRDFSKVPVTNFNSVFLKFKKSCFFVSGAKKLPWHF